MSSGFLAVNTIGVNADSPVGSDTAQQPMNPTPQPHSNAHGMDADAAASGTAPRPAGAIDGLAAQRPLPPTTDAEGKSTLAAAPNDTEMGGTDVDAMSQDEDDDSKGGVETAKAKKKTQQKFHCTDFPPCQLSFTRSEHLARHIRKHTGERPFQCHCLRYFTRLDNLRQHAQTVHQDENIPSNSLAAHGTRYQRHVRSSRIRGGGRSRSTGGHNRNLSTSSITSTSSYFSQAPDDSPQRTQQIGMPMDGPHRPAFEEYRSPPTSPYRPASPVHYGQPNQYPDGPNQMLSGPFASSRHVRGDSTSSIGPLGPRGHSRRLSFPSANPMPSSTATPPILPPLSSTSQHFPSNGSVYDSPTASAFSSRRTSFSSDAPREPDPRRRTWHPSSFPARPPLLGSDTPLTMTPSRLSQNFGSNIRLPPIESLLKRPMTPQSVREEPSAMDVDSARPPPSRGWENLAPTREGGSPGIERGLQQTMTRLDISGRQAPPPPPPQPQQQAPPQHLEHAPTWPLRGRGHVRHHSDLGFHPHSSTMPGAPYAVARRHEYGHNVESMHAKRQGMYFGPPMPTRYSPEGSNSSEGPITPSTMPEYHPSIRNSGSWEQNPSPLAEEVKLPQTQSFPEQQSSGPPPTRPPHSHRRTESDMVRLEALVEAASREGGS